MFGPFHQWITTTVKRGVRWEIVYQISDCFDSSDKAAKIKAPKWAETTRIVRSTIAVSGEKSRKFANMGNRRDHHEEDDDECFEKYLPILGIVVAVIFIAIFTFVCCRSCKRKRERSRFRSKLLQCFPQIALFMKTLSGIRSHYTTAARAHKGTPAVPNLRQSRKRAHLSVLPFSNPAGPSSLRTVCCSRRSYSSASVSTGFSKQHTTRLQPEL